MNQHNEKYKNIYDTVYNGLENYNYSCPIKDKYIEKYVEIIEVDKTILDVGCGEGRTLRKIIDKGYNAVGLEVSEECCNKHLNSIPHFNNDLLSFVELGHHFDTILCMDVLEHISKDEIDLAIKALTTISPQSFLGIANHSDVIDNVELHLIQEGKSWWFNMLKKHYKQVTYIDSINYNMSDDIFFMFYCSNAEIMPESLILRLFQDAREFNKLSFEVINLKIENGNLLKELQTVKQENLNLKNTKALRFASKLNKILGRI